MYSMKDMNNHITVIITKLLGSVDVLAVVDPVILGMESSIHSVSVQ